MDISEQLVGKGRQVLRLVEGLKVKLVFDDGESRITENHRVRCGAVFVVEFQAGYGCYGSGLWVGLLHGRSEFIE